MRTLLFLPGARADLPGFQAFPLEKDPGGPALAIVRDPLSWLSSIHRHPELSPAADDEGRLQHWREATEFLLRRPRTRLLLYHHLQPSPPSPPLSPLLLAPLLESWQSACALAARPPDGPPPPARPTRAMAKVLAEAWAPQLRGRWTLGTPIEQSQRVIFPLSPEVAMVVEDRSIAVGPLWIGHRLALRLRGEAWAPAEMDALAATVLELDRAGLSFEEPRSERVELFISSACTLRCYFCMESERIAQRSFMPWKSLEARLEGFAASGIERVQFMGGEATVHPDFLRALQKCRELGLRTYVITNLLAWADRKFAAAVAPLLDEAMVSIHAFGAEQGAAVTGSRSWWPRFLEAHRNFKEFRPERVRASTVLSRHSEEDLERIWSLLAELRPERWVMGSGVPLDGTRLNVVEEGLTLTQLRSFRERFLKLQEECQQAGCALVFFCMPQCVLGPGLWEHTHEEVVDNQDLSDTAEATTVNFWSRADYDARPRPVLLGRSRPESCGRCARKNRCGGYFTRYFERYGTEELEPILEEGVEGTAGRALR